MEPLDELAAQVFQILGEAGIPAEIIGGYALSHYGYVRNTMDIDVVVRDHKEAIEVLKQNGFEEAERWWRLRRPGSGKHVDVLPSGKRMSGNQIPNPTVSQVSSSPAFTPLKELITLKAGVPVAPATDVVTAKKNELDVQVLIKANSLPMDYLDDAPELVKLEYVMLWQELHQTGKKASLDEQDDPFGEFW